MYQFTDVNQKASIIKTLPLEAMSFNGIYLENEIKGYETMSVSGRELLSKRIYSSNIDGLDGEMYQGSNYEPRVLTVKYKLEAKTATEFRTNFNKMNYLLRGEQAKISFNDEPNYEFIGTLSGTNEPDEGALNIVSTFQIFCAVPFKYKIAETISGTGSLTINKEILYEVLPEEIKVTPTALVNRIVITNVTQGKILAILNTFQPNVPIYIYPKLQDVIRNNTSYPEFVEWTSDFENFFLNKNDQITVSPATTKIEIKLRERMV